jgi:hypothetical protein
LLPRELDERLGLSALIGVIAYNLGNLHPAVGRRPVDSAPVCADHPAHRAARMASDVSESPTRERRR